MSDLCICLSGVGIAGCSTIALIELLEEYNVKPDMIIGCGGAALVAALWASGQRLEEIKSNSLRLYDSKSILSANLKSFASMFTGVFGSVDHGHAFFKNTKYMHFLKQLFNDAQIENLSQRLMLQATNVDTGRPFFVENGPLYQAVYASSTILPFFPPIRMGEHWITGGNFSNPVPIDYAVDRQVKYVVSLHVSSADDSSDRGYIQSFSNFVSKSTLAAVKQKAMLLTYVHHGEILNLSHVVPAHSDKKQQIYSAISHTSEYLTSQRDDIEAVLSMYRGN